MLLKKASTMSLSSTVILPLSAACLRRMVVSGKTAYLITDKRLAAIDHGSRKTLWRTPCKDAFSLILAGDALVVGMHDKVRVYESKTGKQLWESAADGRVHGLLVEYDTRRWYDIITRGRRRL